MEEKKLKELKEFLEEQYQELKNGYDFQREYPYQFMSLVGFASGYAPEMKLIEAWELVRSILCE